jgi:pimeloyl-ACP methyl ester carboxylesterase
MSRKVIEGSEPNMTPTQSGVRHRIDGLTVTDHALNLPVDHELPSGETIEVFGREVASTDGEDRPLLVFLQGGPGHEAPRPSGWPSSPVWLSRALQDYRVLMLDQRGTGLSTPYGRPDVDAHADAKRLVHFRADAIVRDAEAFREHLGARRWTVLGQSFGGYCGLHYLSVAPDSLDGVIFTGGIPPIGRPVDDVYAKTYVTMRMLNERHHRKYPTDRDRLHRVLDLCDEGELVDSAGNSISRRLARTVGHQLGTDGGSDALHHLLERDPDSPAFVHDLVAMFPFGARNPLYAVLHESSYADGGATRWSADRTLPEDFSGDSALLTGEHLYAWHFEDTAELRPYSEVAGLLAEHEWPSLFDADVLSHVDVPCAAVVYVDDPYVDMDFSLETAQVLPRLQTWITNQYLHSGLRSGGDQVLGRLIDLVRGSA